ncbi:MAG: hypothetical protein IM638_05400 [Bacteroidetes bacterium]|nr:hypothetical protein [Bacteroidota bacterium]
MSLAQPLVVNERLKRINVQAGNIALWNSFTNRLANMPWGWFCHLNTSKYWQQDNRRATRAGVGLRYERMFAFTQYNSFTHISTEGYREKNQKALYVQLDLMREIPFGQSPVYSIWGASVNIKAWGVHTGTYYSTNPFGTIVERYINQKDQTRRAVYAVANMGIGAKIGSRAGIELLFHGGFSPNENHKASIGSSLGLFLNLGKPDTKEKTLFFQGI